jgi:hypothetical protein
MRTLKNGEPKFRFFWTSIYGEGPEIIELHSRRVFKVGIGLGFALGALWALLINLKG